MQASAHVDSFARDNLPPKSMWPALLASADTSYPTRLNAAQQLLDEAIQKGWGNNIALRNNEAQCTYMQLHLQVNRIANVLIHKLGLKPGNRVLLRGANHPMMAACWLAVVKAGLIAVPTMPLLRAKELTQIILKAQVQAALCDISLGDEMGLAQQVCPDLKQLAWFNASPTQANSLESFLPASPATFDACDTAADDVALIAFTSGTTGQPKGTLHFHRDLLAMCDLFPRHVLKPTAADVFCGTPPLAFTFGLGGLLCFALRYGASTVLLEKLTPQTLLQAVEQHRATIMFTAPTFYRQMTPLVGSVSLSSLRTCVSAGEALPQATRLLWQQSTGIQLIDGIGATEMIHIFISSGMAADKPGSLGKVVPGYVAKIVDEQMNEVPRGTVGRLAVKGPTGCRYLADERQSNYVKNGWNLPGDTFFQDQDDYFFYQARSDDMIISAGYNIAGPEVEACLLEHPAVAECGVIGSPDEERGQIVKAFVVLRPGYNANPATTQMLQDFVKTQIAPYKYPRAIQWVDRLPRTETGKLQRFLLKTL
jgi:2-aminobenzoate-CoA ligase